jgi:hypothetical protein
MRITEVRDNVPPYINTICFLLSWGTCLDTRATLISDVTSVLMQACMKLQTTDSGTKHFLVEEYTGKK